MSDSIIRILREYDIQRPDSVVTFHDGEGFSGSGIWKVAHGSRFYCLKQWPPGKPSDRTRHLIGHVIPAVQQQGLPIAAPLETRDGNRFILLENCWWDLSPWLPGAPGKHSTLTEVQLQQAMEWLARYHNLAADLLSEFGRSAAILYRLQLSRQLLDGQLNRLVERKYAGLAPGLADLFINQAIQQLPRLLGVIEEYADRELVLVPALSDIWSDHLFFQNEEVSGVIDFGAMKLDSPCLDIARLLGSYTGDDGSVLARGIKHYQAARSLNEQDIELIELFDHANVVLSGVQWLIWLGPEQRVFKQMAKVNQRLKSLAQRMVC